MEFLNVCPLALIAGLVDAVTGGGGSISIPAYFFTGLPPHAAIVTSWLFSAMGTNVAALVVFLVNGEVLVGLGLAAGAFNIIGNWIGASLFDKKGAAILRPIMLVVIALFDLRIKAHTRQSAAVQSFLGLRCGQITWV